MLPTSQEYLDMDGEPLPYTTKWGFTMTQVDIDCTECGKLCIDNKYRFNEFQNSLDVVGIGVCHDCKIVVSGKPLRVYKDERVSWRHDNGQWVWSWMKYSNPLVRLKKWFQRKFLRF